MGLADDDMLASAGPDQQEERPGHRDQEVCNRDAGRDRLFESTPPAMRGEIC
jgi:hypothetical protein